MALKTAARCVVCMRLMTVHSWRTRKKMLSVSSVFQDAAVRSGLTVSLKKTEVLLQPADRLICSWPAIMPGGTAFPAVERFCYLGSTMSADANVDDDVSSCIAEASQSFGRLLKRLWDDHGIRLETKVAVYKAAILTILLYGSESWVLYRRHIRKLEHFHSTCEMTR